jgi:signal peptidase II
VHDLQTEGRTALILGASWPIVRRVAITAWVIWILDLLSKTLVAHYLEGKNSVRVIGNFLQLNLTRNSGAAFSFAPGGTVFLTSFGLVVVAVIIFTMGKVKSHWWAITLGFVLGGTLGNLTDRIFRGSSLKGEVIDWIQLPMWPIFNLADSAIVLAAGFAVILTVKNISPTAPPTVKDDEKESHDGA